MMNTRNTLFQNRFSISIFFTVLGILFFFINCTGKSDLNGLLFLSILLMICPTLILLLFDKEQTQLKIFFLALFPLIFYNYIYTITMGTPVGLSDTHIHIIQFNNFIVNNFLHFSTEDPQRISLVFIGLYMLFYFIKLVSQIDIVYLVIYIVPLINIFVIISVYLIGSKLFNKKIGILAMILYGWENKVLNFGIEYRTQTIGTLSLFLVIFLIILINNKFDNNPDYKIKIPQVLFLTSIVVASFVSFFNALVIFLLFFLLSLIMYILSTSKVLSSIIPTSIIPIWKKKDFPLTIGIFLIFIGFFVLYILYVSNFSSDFFSTIINLYSDMINSAAKDEYLKTMTNVEGVGQLLYGKFVQYSYYIYWITFALCSILFLFNSLKQKFYLNLVFLVVFGLYFFVGLFNATYSGFSPSRSYLIGSVIISIVIASACYNFNMLFKNKKSKKILKFLIFILVIMIVSGSIVKLPNYVIGETFPFRSQEKIDSVYYWDSNLPSYKAFSFLSYYPKTDVSLNMNIIYYYFSKYVHETKNNNVFFNQFIVHDKFYGKYYDGRSDVVPIDSFYAFNKIYSNEDFLIFLNK